MLTWPLSCWHEWEGVCEEAPPGHTTLLPQPALPRGLRWQRTPAALAPWQPSAFPDLAPLGPHVRSTCRKQHPLPLEFPLQVFHIHAPCLQSGKLSWDRLSWEAEAGMSHRPKRAGAPQNLAHISLPGSGDDKHTP